MVYYTLYKQTLSLNMLQVMQVYFFFSCYLFGNCQLHLNFKKTSRLQAKVQNALQITSMQVEKLSKHWTN